MFRLSRRCASPSLSLGLLLALSLPGWRVEAEEAAIEAGKLALIAKGKAVGELVIPDNAPRQIVEATEDFRRLVERASGALLPVITESELDKQPPSRSRLYIGDTRFAASRKLSSKELPEETYRIIIDGGNGLIVGHDLIRSPQSTRHEANSLAVRWALNHLLEKQVGVRWLWPGQLGTYVPRSSEITFEPYERTYQPRYIMRRQRILRMIDGPGKLKGSDQERPRIHSDEERRQLVVEAIQWLENHQGGRRGQLLQQGEPFSGWWDRYSKDHPDYFAELTPDLKQPFRSPSTAKLRLANPAVIEQIARNYEEAGAPASWKISPSDRGGFDISKETRAWDIPQNQPLDAIIYGEANLTARYVEFWNRVYARLVQINPEVILNSLVYASYRHAPPAERPLRAKMILSMTPAYTEYELWKKWAETGSQLILRPNWWIAGAGAPWIPLRQVENYFKYCHQNGLVGFDFDAILGYWAPQGISYYLVARLGVDPTLTRDEILNEYTSAFGAGAPAIRRYLDYWESFSDRAGYSIHVGGHVSGDLNGLFSQIAKERGFPDSPWTGSYQVMPYLYTDEAIAPSEALLDEALAATRAAGQEEESERVLFLREGLAHLRLLRDTIGAAQALEAAGKDAAPAELVEAHRNKCAELYAFRRKIGARHSLWPEWLYFNEDRVSQPTIPQNIHQEAPDLRAE